MFIINNKNTVLSKIIKEIDKVEEQKRKLIQLIVKQNEINEERMCEEIYAIAEKISLNANEIQQEILKLNEKNNTYNNKKWVVKKCEFLGIDNHYNHGIFIRFNELEIVRNVDKRFFENEMFPRVTEVCRESEIFNSQNLLKNTKRKFSEEFNNLKHGDIFYLIRSPYGISSFEWISKEEPKFIQDSIETHDDIINLFTNIEENKKDDSVYNKIVETFNSLESEKFYDNVGGFDNNNKDLEFIQKEKERKSNNEQKKKETLFYDNVNVFTEKENKINENTKNNKKTKYWSDLGKKENNIELKKDEILEKIYENKNTKKINLKFKFENFIKK